MAGVITKIAVTGGAASGKTTVCRRFAEKGMKLILLDLLAREVVVPGEKAYRELVSHFGSEVVLKDGTLNRPYLRKCITADKKVREIVEGIVQPAIICRMEQQIEEFSRAGELFVVVEVPLLFETGMEKGFDATVVVAVDREIQLGRLMERDGVSRNDAEALIKIQMSQEDKVKRADIIVENNGTYTDLVVVADSVFEKLVENINNMSKALDR